MSKRVVYKHKFVITVLSEQERAGYTLADIDYAITQGPDLGDTELESVEKITDRETVVKECVALGNDGGFFTDCWDEWDEEETNANI